MRKISLKNLNLKEVEQLSREQLKNVLGGFTGGTDMGTDPGTTEGENLCTDSCGGTLGQCGPNQLCDTASCYHNKIQYSIKSCFPKPPIT